MTRKQGQNEGSIRKREDGTWEARVPVSVDANGRQINKSLFGKTKSEAIKKIKEAMKRKKPSQNEGSIRKRKDGTWEARVTIGVDANGRQIRRSLYGKTKEEAFEKMRGY